jgi:hypothetical protein
VRLLFLQFSFVWNSQLDLESLNLSSLTPPLCFSTSPAQHGHTPCLDHRSSSCPDLTGCVSSWSNDCPLGFAESDDLKLKLQKGHSPQDETSKHKKEACRFMGASEPQYHLHLRPWIKLYLKPDQTTFQCLELVAAFYWRWGFINWNKKPEINGDR